MSTKLFKCLLYSAFIALVVGIVYPAYADLPYNCLPNGLFNAFADVTGDGLADAIVVKSSGITVRHSTASGFGADETWTTNPYYGDKGIYFADVTGPDVDGKRRADAIVVNSFGNGITVRPATTGGVFGPNENWTTAPYYGDKGTFFADVTGDGRADAIVVNSFGNGITVRPATTGGVFGPNENWTTAPYYGDRGTYFADVTGPDADGKSRADAIVVNSSNIVVRPAIIGGGFGTAKSWTTNAYYGDHGTYFADVTGDKRADAVVVNSSGITVRRAGEDIFSTTYELWSSTPINESEFFGTYFADMTGDTRADEFVLNRTSGVARSWSDGDHFINTQNILLDYYSDLAPNCIN